MLKNTRLTWIPNRLKGFRVSQDDKYDNLCNAICNGDFNLVKEWIEKGADPNFIDEMTKYSSIHCSAVLGKSKILEYLISKNGNINTLGLLNYQPIHLACREGHLECVKILLKSGANPISRSERGESPIGLSRSGGYTEIVSLLENVIKHLNVRVKKRRNSEIQVDAILLNETPSGLNDSIFGDDILNNNNNNNNDKKEDDIILAKKLASTLKKSDLKVLSQLELDKKLYKAVKKGNFEDVKIWLDEGGNVNGQDKEGENCLHHASTRGYTEIVKLILDEGNINDLDLKSEEGDTALLQASRNGFADIVQLLINSGADHTIRDEDGYNGIHEASSYGYLDIVKIYLSLDQELIESINNRGWSPLHFSSFYGHPNVVKYLLNEGGDPFLKNDRGKIPYEFAKQEGHTEIEELLLTTMNEYKENEEN